jgi:hypothetical protein
MASKPSLREVMANTGLTVIGLAQKSGLARETVQRAVDGNDQARLNTTSVTAIANALGLPVGAFNWPHGLTNRGRNALTGGKYTRRKIG